MRSKFLPFSRPSITDADIAAVGEVLRSGWITTGPKTAEFEQKFCEYVGCQGAVALTSATAGMHLALKALDIGAGDEVITPSMTWVSTVNLIVLAGATPVFADIDKDTLMVSRDTVEQCITPPDATDNSCALRRRRGRTRSDSSVGRGTGPLPSGRCGPCSGHALYGRTRGRERHIDLLFSSDQEHHNRRGRHVLLFRPGLA